ncbi:MAG: hypothetical protein SGI98_00075 [Verrucomicrobiota bacterium]|nr:hypothetical protein [Verrucomicrobiota bacterium]
MAPRKDPKPVRISLAQAYSAQFSPDLSSDSPDGEKDMPVVAVDKSIPSLFTEEDFERVKQFAGNIPGKLLPSTHEEKTPERKSEIPIDPNAGKLALEYGNWWHVTMQFFPWKKDAEQITRYRDERLAVIGEGGLLKKRAERELDLFMGCELFKQLCSPKSIVAPEIPFSRLIGQKGLQDGIIDLVWLDETGGVHLIDWKTDYFGGRVPVGQEIDQATDYYRSQLTAYREALEGFGCGVKDVSIYFTAAGIVPKL